MTVGYSLIYPLCTLIKTLSAKQLFQNIRHLIAGTIIKTTLNGILAAKSSEEKLTKEDREVPHSFQCIRFLLRHFPSEL